jgi:hypothetical protein
VHQLGDLAFHFLWIECDIRRGSARLWIEADPKTFGQAVTNDNLLMVRSHLGDSVEELFVVAIGLNGAGPFGWSLALDLEEQRMLDQWMRDGSLVIEIVEASASERIVRQTYQLPGAGRRAALEAFVKGCFPS